MSGVWLGGVSIWAHAVRWGPRMSTCGWLGYVLNMY